jgi:hypothetical protein
VLKFRYSEKDTRFEKKSISSYLTLLDNVKEIGRFFSKICGLLRMSELYHQALDRLLLLFRLMNCSVTTMAIRVVKFSNRGYKIRKKIA